MGKSNLQGIANGLLGTFVSRNNDIGGYWGLGILRSEAVATGQQEITIDLLIEPLAYGAARNLGERYRLWLRRMLSKQNLSLNELSVARITLRFANSFDEFPDVIKDTRGLPYQCSVELQRVSQKLYIATKVGVCALQDPSRDRQSTRAV